jgi:hypothetical protein
MDASAIASSQVGYEGDVGGTFGGGVVGGFVVGVGVVGGLVVGGGVVGGFVVGGGVS